MQRRFSLISPCFLLFTALARADSALVVPFFNSSNNPSLDWIGESIGETVREGLASQGILTLSRDDREEAWQRLQFHTHSTLTLASVMRLGQTLDADTVIYGDFDLKNPPISTANARGTLRITAHVLDLKHTSLGPQFEETGALDDLAVLQRHVAWQALKMMSPDSAPSEEEFAKRNPVVRADAIESYIRGLLATTADEKRKLFNRAVRLNPGYSQAAFELGRLNLDSHDYRGAIEWLQKVSPGDVHFNQANFLLGLARYDSGDFAGAAAAFQRVAESVPLNEVLNNLGAALSRRNDPAAIGNFQKALDGDASDPVYQFNVGYALWKEGNFAPAVDRFRAVLERDPQDQDAPVLLALCLQGSGPKKGDARTQALERLKTNYEESAWFQLKAILQKKP